MVISLLLHCLHTVIKCSTEGNTENYKEKSSIVFLAVVNSGGLVEPQATDEHVPSSLSTVPVSVLLSQSFTLNTLCCKVAEVRSPHIDYSGWRTDVSSDGWHTCSLAIEPVCPGSWLQRVLSAIGREMFTCRIHHALSSSASVSLSPTSSFKELRLHFPSEARAYQLL